MTNIPTRSSKPIRPCWEAVLNALPDPDDLEVASEASITLNDEDLAKRLSDAAKQVRSLQQQHNQVP